MRRLKDRRLGWVIALAAVFALWLAAAPAGAQTANPAPGAPAQTSVQDLEALAATLKDDAKRAELLARIQALIEVAKGTPAPEAESLSTGIISTLSATAGQVSRQLVTAVNRLGDLPALAGWFKRQFTDATARNLWLFALLKLAAVIVVGGLAERLAGALLARPRQAVEGRETTGLLLRLPLLLLRTVMDLLPVAAFAVVAYVLLPLLNPGSQTRVMVVTFLSAYVLARVLTIVMRMALVPAVPSLRVLPIEAETANYLFIWSRRLIAIWVIGYYAGEAALLFGLPGSAHAGLLRVLGLFITVMIVVFILQNRAAVAEVIRGRPSPDTPLSTANRLRRRLGDVWHVLAILYVIGVFAVWALNIAGGFEYLTRATVVSAVILVAAKGVAMALRRGIERGFAVSADVAARFPLLEIRVNRYVPLIHLVLRVVLYLIAGLALLQAWGIDTLGWLDSPFGRRITGGAFSIGVILIVALILWEGVSSSIERYLGQTDADGALVQRSARARTLLPLLRNAVMVFLLVMVTLIVLAELGVNIGPLLAGAGVIGLAVGFGSQKLVQDVINGIFILFEDSVAVGDVVTAAGISGVVERLSIRSLRLRDLTGNVHTIPFSAVETVTNMTKDFSMAVIEAGVAYRENIDDVIAALRQLGTEMKDDPDYAALILEPLEVLGVDALADSAVIIKCRFKTVPLKQWMIRREFNRRMKNRFDELGIEIPYPHQTVYFGVGKDGMAPPAFVQTLTGAQALADQAKDAEDQAKDAEGKKEKAAPPPQPTSKSEEFT